MNQETKICQNCGNDFIIESGDFAFYAKINVPPPTFCSNCRLQRRLAWRNERILYKRKCDAPGHNEDIISIYPPKFSGEKFRRVNHKNSPFKVYDQKYWWSDSWDPMGYGRNYDWNKPFFEQFGGLMNVTPVAALNDKNSINSDYCNYGVDNKGCYFSVGSGKNENVFYSTYAWLSKDVFDNYNITSGELCYENIDSETNYKTFFAEFCNNIIDGILLYDSKNCSNCIASINLRNKNYFFLNQLVDKNKIKNVLLNVSSYKKFIDLSGNFKKLKLTQPHRYAKITKSYNVTGDNIKESKDCSYAFEIVTFGSGGAEDCKFIFRAGANLKDSYDVSQTGFNVSLVYETVSLIRGSRVFFSHFTWDCMDVLYSVDCHNSSNLFACVGLHHKQYCILNKQYTKEEYEALVPKIIQHMNDTPYVDKKGRVYKYGEFFPIELSPFSYNETVAQEYFPLTKEQTINKGYSWKEPEERNYQIDIKAEDLPDHIKDVKDDILGKVIGCFHQNKCNEQCTTAFKIIEPELQFYRKMNLPLPRLCPNCRHYQRIKQRNPLKLWHRKCMCAGIQSDNGIYKNTIEHSHHKQGHCPNEFETSYAPERPEIVYCEKCYLREVA